MCVLRVSVCVSPPRMLSVFVLAVTQIAGTGVRRAGVGKLAKVEGVEDESDGESAILNEFGYLKAFDVASVLASGSVTVDAAVYSVRVCKGDSVVCVNWHPLTKQIIVGCGDGATHVYYDPTITENGAMLSAARAPARYACVCVRERVCV